MLYGVIMAGGSGTRFWPLSRKQRPKQAMPFLGGKSLFQRALDRVEALAPPEHTLIITNEDQAELLASQAGGLPRENIVGEPLARDSAAAVFLAASIVVEQDPDAVTLVKPADHLISPVEKFAATVNRAVSIAGEGFLVTFGVRPTSPATGYGYIERGEKLEAAEDAYRVVRFHEKPDRQTAERYLAEGRYYWNSGIFVWRAADILEAAREFAPEHFEAIRPLGRLFGTGEFAPALREAYEPLEKISIDFGVMERAQNIATVEADFQWSDVGSPVALRGCHEPDESGNVRRGLTHTLDAANCVLLSDEDHLVAAVGCEDLVVIHTDDATLVCPADRVGDVKRLVSELRRREETRDRL